MLSAEDWGLRTVNRQDAKSAKGRQGTSETGASPDLATLVDDALARWRWLVERREAVIGAIVAARRGAEEEGDAGDYWTARAPTVGAFLRAGGPNPVLDLVLPAVDHGTTVLDVGAGAGRFAIPLAAAAGAVTAVDPTPALLALLREDAAAAGLTNLRIVESTWEDAAVEPADIVLCANVVTPIADIGPFLRKLDAHATQRCYVVTRATAFDAPLVDLWGNVHGVHYPREPGHVDLYAALDALGAAAQAFILPLPGTLWDFDSPEAAERLVRDRLWLGPAGRDARSDALVADFLATTLAHGADGRYRLPAPPPRTAVFWWEQGQPGTEGLP